MKKSILIIIAVFSLHTVFSQNFVSEEKQWNVKVTLFGYAVAEIFKIEGDSTVNAITYKKVWQAEETDIDNPVLAGLIREEGDKVFLKRGNNPENLLYDFGIEEGDTVGIINMYCSGNMQLVVDKVDMVDYFGVERKRWTLSSSYDLDEYWIEGIGSLSGPLHPGVANCVTDPDLQLLCYHINGELLYIKEEEHECYILTLAMDEISAEKPVIYPNPAQDKLLLSGRDFTTGTYHITNLSGKLLGEGRLTANTESIDIGLLPAGTYLLMLPGINSSFKFIKK